MDVKWDYFAIGKEEGARVNRQGYAEGRPEPKPGNARVIPSFP